MPTRLILALLALAACGKENEQPRQLPAHQAPAPGPDLASTEPEERVVRVLRGKAIWYGGKWHGKTTASGEIFDKEQMTAAHRSLPFQTRVRVVNVDNDRRVTVRINDRGPYGADRRRIIDVSEAASRALGFGDRGEIRVRLEVLAGSWWDR